MRAMRNAKNNKTPTMWVAIILDYFRFFRNVK